MKKTICALIAGLMCIGVFAGCNSGEGSGDDAITVITRESGSGTRGAFIELFGKKTRTERRKINPLKQQKNPTAPRL